MVIYIFLDLINTRKMEYCKIKQRCPSAHSEGIWRSGAIAPHILTLGSSCSYTCVSGDVPREIVLGLAGSKVDVDASEKTKTLRPTQTGISHLRLTQQLLNKVNHQGCNVTTQIGTTVCGKTVRPGTHYPHVM